LKEIAKEGLLTEDGIVVAEHSVRDKLEERYGALGLSDRRRYGDTELSFFRNGERVEE